MTTAQPPAGVALRADEATYVRARCQHDGQTILRAAAWSTLKGRVLPLAGYPWIHASTGDEECPLAAEIVEGIEIILDGLIEEAELTQTPAITTHAAAERIVAFLSAREALATPPEQETSRD
jgi:hypothetical protein